MDDGGHNLESSMSSHICCPAQTVEKACLKARDVLEQKHEQILKEGKNRVTKAEASLLRFLR